MGLANFPPAQNSFGSAAVSPIGGGRGRVKYSDDSGAGAAGTYSVTVTQPGGSTLLDIVVTAISLWNAGTSADGIVGAADPDGWFTSMDMKATDMLATESIAFALAGGLAGAYIANSATTLRYSAADRDITLSIVCAGTAATTGETIMDVLWFWPSRGESTGSFTAA